MVLMSLETPDAPPVKKFPVKKEYIIGAILVLLAIVPSTYLYLQYQKSQSRLLNRMKLRHWQPLTIKTSSKTSRFLQTRKTGIRYLSIPMRKKQFCSVRL